MGVAPDLEYSEGLHAGFEAGLQSDSGLIGMTD
jgi:hypothetical protein